MNSHFNSATGSTARNINSACNGLTSELAKEAPSKAKSECLCTRRRVAVIALGMARCKCRQNCEW